MPAPDPKIITAAMFTMHNSLDAPARDNDEVIVIEAPNERAALRTYVSWAWKVGGGLASARLAVRWTPRPVLPLAGAGKRPAVHTTPPNRYGVCFAVRLVRAGGRYGLHECLTHTGEDPLVEFYDTRYPHTRYGQFVSRYYLSTLRGPTPYQGVQLDGGTPEWSVDASALATALEVLGA